MTVITDTQATDPGYAAFTDAELIPHTDGTSQGGNTLLADAARITATRA